jgi:voltage-gated potassium channel
MLKRFLLPLALVATLLTGSVGFMLIEGWSFFDSLYMTVITLTTIGYSEIHKLSDQGRFFNIFLIIFGVGVATYSISRMIADLASIDFDKRRRTKMKNKIDKMEGHTIVCGFGRMGEVICKSLAEYKNNFVVVEKRPQLIEELKKLGYLYIEGDAANDDHLIEAGVRKAKVMVSVIDSDSDGLYIALASRSMNKDIFIIVRANEQKAKRRMILAGANKVVLPFIMSGQKVADTVMNNATEDLFDITSQNYADKIQLADLTVTGECGLKGKTLEEMGDQLKNLIIIGIKDRHHNFSFKPGSNYIFREGDCVVAMGPLEDYNRAKESLNLR